MKKIITILMICCFSIAVTAATPEPVFAAGQDNTVLIVVVSTAAIAGLLGLVLLSNDDGVNTMREKYNPRLYKWTYDELLSEKGQPTKVSEDKDTILAEYYNAKLINKGNTVYHAGSFLKEASSDTETQAVTRFYGDRYWFYFDKNKKTLTGWMCSRMADSGETAIWHAMGGNRNFIPENTDKPVINTARTIPPPGPPGAEKNTAEIPKSLEQKLKELKSLKDKKLITEEEYKTAKQKLLDNAVK